MAHTTDVPGSIRIRTDDGNEWRFDAVESAAEFYDRNRSDSVAYACHDVPELVDAVQDVLERDDLTLRQRKEIAETFDHAARGLEISVDLDVGLE